MIYKTFFWNFGINTEFKLLVSKSKNWAAEKNLWVTPNVMFSSYPMKKMIFIEPRCTSKIRTGGNAFYSCYI